MVKSDTQLFTHLNENVVEGIKGFRLDSYLIALEGWRRGLELTWYKDESDLCKLDRLNSSTQGKFFSLSDSNRTHYFFRSRGDKVSNKSVRICQDKVKTKEYLESSGVPIPLGDTFENDRDIINYAESIGYPVIVKPLRGSMGKGVHTNIRDKSELIDVLEELRSRYEYKAYMIEKHYFGNEYRVYVVGDEVIGATNRIPANVIGDGVSSIEELIKIKNNKRKENPYLAPKPIKVDFEVKNVLKSQGYNLKSILPNGQRLLLKNISNLSSGGDPIEATDELSDEVKQIAVQALKALPSIPHAGVDIIVDPDDRTKGVVLEINATAEIAFHLYPLQGRAKDIPAAIINYYFPKTTSVPRSPYYFDYQSTIEPLRNWTADEIKISTPPVNYEAKLITVTGKIKKVGYMNFIRRQALRRGLHGNIKHIDERTIEIEIYNIKEQEMEAFSKICEKGSRKSRVDNVSVKSLEVNPEISRRLGFNILSGKQ